MLEKHSVLSDSDLRAAAGPSCARITVADAASVERTLPQAHQTKNRRQGHTTCPCCLLALSVPLLLQLVKGGKYGLGIIGIRWAAAAQAWVPACLGISSACTARSLPDVDSACFRATLSKQGTSQSTTSIIEVVLLCDTILSMFQPAPTVCALPAAHAQTATAGGAPPPAAASVW